MSCIPIFKGNALVNALKKTKMNIAMAMIRVQKKKLEVI